MSKIGNIGALFFKELTVARYLTLAPAGFTVPASPQTISTDHTVRFDAPGLSSGSTVIFFRTSNANAAPFSVYLNDKPPLIQNAVADTRPQCWHLVIPAGVLRPEDNDLDFSARDGNVTFSDLVVLYMSNRLAISNQLLVSPGGVA